VCTHPDFRGRGYAGLLSRTVATQILRRGETPFLHAFATNTAAIALYESLGFVLRCKVAVTVLRRG
jgi:predicted GNAT family acetyltransferase